MGSAFDILKQTFTIHDLTFFFVPRNFVIVHTELPGTTCVVHLLHGRTSHVFDRSYYIVGKVNRGIYPVNVLIWLIWILQRLKHSWGLNPKRIVKCLMER